MFSGVDVRTGQVKVSKKANSLFSGAIGSCVVVVAIDTKNNIGGIAHVMLPGKAPEEMRYKTRYAADAVAELIKNMRRVRAVKKLLKVFIAGGANVLRLKNCKIGKNNIKSVTKVLQEEGMRVLAENVGGIQRRRIKLDIFNKVLYYAKGDGKAKVLWEEKV